MLSARSRTVAFGAEWIRVLGPGRLQLAGPGIRCAPLDGGHVSAIKHKWQGRELLDRTKCRRHVKELQKKRAVRQHMRPRI